MDANTKRPRFDDNFGMDQEEDSKVEMEEDDFVKRLDNLLKPIESRVKIENGDVIKSDLQVGTLFPTQVNNLDAGKAVSINATNVKLELVPAYNVGDNPTRFPFHRDYKFKMFNSLAVTIDDYLFNQDPNLYKDELSEVTFLMKYNSIAETGAIIKESEICNFYKNVPWVQMENTYKCVSYPFKSTTRKLIFNIKDEKLKGYLPYDNDDIIQGKGFPFNVKFDEEILQVRRTVIANDILSLLLIFISRCDDNLIQEVVTNYRNLVKEVYPETYDKKTEAVISGGAVYWNSALVGSATSNEAESNKATNVSFLSSLLISALDLNEYDTRIGFLIKDTVEKTLNNFLLDVKMSIKLFQNTLGITDIAGLATGDIYANWIESYNTYAEALKDYNNKSAATTSTFFAAVATIFSVIRKIRGENALNTANDELLLAFNDMTKVGTELKLEVPILVANIRAVGDKLSDQIKVLKTVEVTQREEITRLKRKITALEKGSGSGTGGAAATANVPLSSLLDNVGRNYLNLLIKEFLSKSVAMKLVYAVAGAVQQKDISNYLNANVPQVLLERLCFVNNDEKNKTWWQLLEKIEDVSFNEGVDVPPPYIKLLLTKLNIGKPTCSDLEDTMSFFTSAPLQKAFYEVISYVKLLYKKSRTKPIDLDILTTSENKGVIMEIASYIAAVITKEQDLQKQHATTRFDKPGINMNLVNAKLTIRMKMSIHLGFNFDNVNTKELI